MVTKNIIQNEGANGSFYNLAIGDKLDHIDLYNFILVMKHNDNRGQETYISKLFFASNIDEAKKEFNKIRDLLGDY